MPGAEPGAEHGPGRRSRWRSRWTRRAGWALVVVAATALAGWLAGPALLRFAVERVLSWRLEGDVTLDSVRVLGRRSFLLDGVVVEEPGIERRLAELRAASVRVEGGVLRILGGSIDAIDLGGVEARLAPASPGGFELEAPRTSGVELLRVHDGVLLFPARGAGAIDFDLVAFDLGGTPRGELRVRAPVFDLRALGDVGLVPVGLRVRTLG